MTTTGFIPQLKNQYLIIYILDKLVKTLFNCGFVPQNNIGSQPQYPFVSYQLITAEDATTSDNTDQFNVRIQLDCHDNDQIQANNMAQSLKDALKDDGYRRFFKQANVVPHSITATSNRTTLPFINYDQDFGFDCSFLVTGKDKVYDPEKLSFDYTGDTDIASIQAQGKTGSVTIGIDTDKSKEDFNG